MFFVTSRKMFFGSTKVKLEEIASVRRLFQEDRVTDLTRNSKCIATK